MEQQSSGEFAPTDPTKGEEDARVQERGVQRPAPSHLSKNLPSLQDIGPADVA
jgi:hypothetical protein